VYTAGDAAKRGSAKQRAYEHLKQLILTRSGQTAEFLGEEALAAELGVSRTPIREAFLRLEAEHLLQLVPGKGAFIPTVTEAEVASVIEVRGLIEVFAGRRLATAPEAQRQERIALMQESHEGQAQALGEGTAGVARFIFLDREFHRAVIEAASNPVLLEIYERLRDRELRMDAQAHGKYPTRLADAYDEHGLIVKALEQGDPDAVEQAIKTHLANTSLALR
jgi:DNA-binding GntR family transcriptional regulator